MGSALIVGQDSDTSTPLTTRIVALVVTMQVDIDAFQLASGRTALG